jgi:hypothetical protein
LRHFYHLDFIPLLAIIQGVFLIVFFNNRMRLVLMQFLLFLPFILFLFKHYLLDFGGILTCLWSNFQTGPFLLFFAVCSLNLSTLLFFLCFIYFHLNLFFFAEFLYFMSLLRLLLLFVFVEIKLFHPLLDISKMIKRFPSALWVRIAFPFDLVLPFTLMLPKIPVVGFCLRYSIFSTLYSFLFIILN